MIFDLGLARTFGTGDVEVFDHAGHWLPAEEPGWVGERLVDFFGRSSSGV